MEREDSQVTQNQIYIILDGHTPKTQKPIQTVDFQHLLIWVAAIILENH